MERRGAKLNAGVLFVFPSGSVWQKLIAEGSRKRRRAEFTDVDEDFDAVEAAEIWMRRELQTQKQSFKTDHKYCFNVKQATEHLEAIKYNSLRACATKRKKTKRTKAVGTGKESAPASTHEALNCEKAHEWVKSLGNEFWGLVDMGVLDLGYTMQQLKDIGITSTSILLGEYYECKFDEDGDVNKRKSRMAVQGHPGNMKKDIRYSETFSATPRESSARILCALVALMNLKRVSFDITKAYCWADLPPGELIALKYPSAFQEFDPITNEKLYPPLGVEVIRAFQEFQSSENKFKSKKNASRNFKRRNTFDCAHQFCFDLDLLMLNRSCSSSAQLFLSINLSRSVY